MDTSVALFKAARDSIESIFNSHGIYNYPTDSGNYKAVTSRGSIYCIGFVYNGEKYYVYFNTSYNAYTNTMSFSSVSIISKDNLALGRDSLEHKWHITNYEELEAMVNDLMILYKEED